MVNPKNKPEPKLRFDLIPVTGMHELARAFTVGAGKHGDDDWLINPKPIRHHVGALLRHLYAFLAGEVRDRDGQHHIASVAARALMIIELLNRDTHEKQAAVQQKRPRAH